MDYIDGTWRSHFCPVCGNELIAKGNGYFVCSICKELIQTDLSKIQQFLLDYPNATVIEIAAQFSFSPEYVQQFYDSGDLSEEALKKADLHCKTCHTRIPYGNYCDNCKRSVASALRQTPH